MFSSALALFGLAAFAMGKESSSSCPVSTVITSTIDQASIVQAPAQTETNTNRDPLTFTTTLANYTRTTTLTHTPDTHTVKETTGTTTALNATATTYTYDCTSNSTV